MTTLWDTTGSAVVKELDAQRRTGGAVLSGVALTLVSGYMGWRGRRRLEQHQRQEWLRGRDLQARGKTRWTAAKPLRHRPTCRCSRGS